MKPCLFPVLFALSPVLAMGAQLHSDAPALSSPLAVRGTASALAADSTQDAKRHPLKGVVTAIYSDRSSLMVKHEAIPGVMRAMTMLFRVDEATLKSVQPGQTITAMMSRQADEWWLHDVKVVAAAPAK